MAFNRAGSRSGTAGDAYNTSASFAIPPASSYDELLLGTPNHQDFLRGMDHSFDNSDVVPRSSASPRKALGFIDLSQVTPRRRSPRKHRTPVRSQSRSRRSSPEKLAKILEMGDGQEDHNEGERQVQDKTDIPEDGLVVETTQGDSAVSASPELAISEPSPSKPSERESLRPKKKKHSESPEPKRPLKPKSTQTTEQEAGQETQAQTAAAKPKKHRKAAVDDTAGVGSFSQDVPEIPQQTLARESVKGGPFDFASISQLPQNPPAKKRAVAHRRDRPSSALEAPASRMTKLALALTMEESKPTSQDPPIAPTTSIASTSAVAPTSTTSRATIIAPISPIASPVPIASTSKHASPSPSPPSIGQKLPSSAGDEHPPSAGEKRPLSPGEKRPLGTEEKRRDTSDDGRPKKRAKVAPQADTKRSLKTKSSTSKEEVPRRAAKHATTEPTDVAKAQKRRDKAEAEPASAVASTSRAVPGFSQGTLVRESVKRKASSESEMAADTVRLSEKPSVTKPPSARRREQSSSSAPAPSVPLEEVTSKLPSPPLGQIPDEGDLDSYDDTFAPTSSVAPTSSIVPASTAEQSLTMAPTSFRIALTSTNVPTTTIASTSRSAVSRATSPLSPSIGEKRSLAFGQGSSPCTTEKPPPCTGEKPPLATDAKSPPAKNNKSPLSTGDKRRDASDDGTGRPKKKARVAPSQPAPSAPNQSDAPAPARSRQNTRSRTATQASPSSSSSRAQRSDTAPRRQTLRSRAPISEGGTKDKSEVGAGASTITKPSQGANVRAPHPSSSSSISKPISDVPFSTSPIRAQASSSKPIAERRATRHKVSEALGETQNPPSRANTFDHREPTKPVQFTFSVESRLKARAGEASATDAPPGRATTSSASSSNTRRAVPDFKKIHAAQEVAALKNRKPKVPVVPVPLKLSTDARVAERSAFDQRTREKEREKQAKLEEERIRREREEEEELKEIRRNAVPKVNEVPDWYKDAPKRGN